MPDSAKLPLSVRLRSLAEQMGTTYTETHWKECRDEILEAAGVIEMMDEEIGRPRGAVKPKDYTFKDHPHPPLMRCGPDCKQSRVQQSEGAAHEAACETCKLQDEAAQPGTRFHVGEDLRSVYMITKSGKHLPVVAGVDFISADFVRDALQAAWGRTEQAQSKDSPQKCGRKTLRGYCINSDPNHGGRCFNPDGTDADSCEGNCAKDGIYYQGHCVHCHGTEQTLPSAPKNDDERFKLWGRIRAAIMHAFSQEPIGYENASANAEWATNKIMEALGFE